VAKSKKNKPIEGAVNDDEVIDAGTEEQLDAATEENEAASSDASSMDTSDGNVSDLEKECLDAKDNLLRLAAEFENYKKRMARDRENYLKYSEEGILKDLLPTIDNLERALEQGSNTDDAASLIEGVDLTLKGLLATLDKYELKPLDSVGQPFDPNFHEALVMEASDEIPAQSIVREFEKGYQFKDRLLRAAKVVVSKGEQE